MHIRDFLGQRVHFIGIGGISMSGLAEILLSRGYQVSGSDQHDNPLLVRLRELGAAVHIGHRAGQQQGAALIVKTAAIPDDNPELAAAREQGIPVMERTDLLGQLMQEYKTAVSVCGTHGKTTTTSMLTTILELTGRNPTAHIGSVLPLIGGTTKAGGREFFITESCEYKDGFLRLFPNIIVMLNIDLDHLDYFRDIDHITSSFAAFADRLPEGGLLVGYGDDRRVRRIMEQCGRRTLSFGLTSRNDWQAANIELMADGCPRFTVLEKGQPKAEVHLAVPGRHNILNALAAMAAASACGVPTAQAAAAVAGYQGAKRRFEKAGIRKGVSIYHDYAHHPAEVAATLSTARGMNPQRLWCVFQPHTYSRTRALLGEFARCFDEADEVILLPIYAAREQDPGDISSLTMARAMKERPGSPPCRYAGSFRDAAAILHAESQSGDMVMTLGAGDIESLAAMILE